MRARILVSGLVALVGLSAAPTAAAAPVDVAEFSTALTTAIATSGALTAGQTLVHLQVDANPMTSDGSRQRDVVNADGSLVVQRSGGGRTWYYRCTARDFCWERVAGRGSDGRWHRMLPGTVTYTPVVASGITPSLEFWPADGAFTATSRGHAQVFTGRYPAASGINVDRWTLTGGSLTRAITRTDAAGRNGQRLLTVTFSSPPSPTRIKAPAKGTIGRPVGAQWTPPGGFRRTLTVLVNAPG